MGLGHAGFSGNLKRRRGQLGLSLLEVVMALVISTVAAVGMMQISSDAQDQIKASAVAEQLKQVYQASQAYMQANSQALVTATASGVVAIPVAKITPTGVVPPGYNGNLPSLQGGGYIPGSFVNANGYGQQLTLLFRRDPLNPANVEGLVISSGGTPIKDNNLGRIANRIGAPGGAYMLSPPAGTAAGTILGVGGGWSTTAAGWTNGVGALTYGHPMAYLSMAQSSALTDYLYRDNIGIPEANTMHTDITMNGALPGTSATIRHNINEAGIVDVQTLTNTAGTAVAVAGEVAATGPIGVNGLDPVIGMPAGWTTGVHAPALYAENILGSGPPGGPPNSWMDYNGNGGFAQSVNIGNSLTVANGANISNGVFVQGSGIIDWPAFGIYITAAAGPWIEVIGGKGLYVQNTVSAGASMLAPVYYDSANSSYYVQPSQTSVLNALYTTGNIDSQGTVEGVNGLITGLLAWPYAACSPNGKLGVSGYDGSLVSCVNGQWHGPGAQLSSFIPPSNGYYGWANSKTGGYSCPAGTQDNKVLTLWYGTEGFNFFHLCIPY